MCTALVRIDPAGRWPLLLAFVRDEDRDRPTLAPGAWWPEQPSAFGPRDARAGGTWIAADLGGAGAAPGLAFVQNQIGPHVTFADASRSPSRGTLPLRALEVGAGFDVGDPSHVGDLDRYQPFHLLAALPSSGREGELAVDWWQWSGRQLERMALQPGIHLIASRGLDMPGERERRAAQLERFSRAAAPEPEPHHTPVAAWGPWIELLDGREARPDDLGGLVVHSVAERPGFGTVGATLVALAADGRVRWDANTTTNLDPGAWQQVDVPATASVGLR